MSFPSLEEFWAKNLFWCNHDQSFCTFVHGFHLKDFLAHNECNRGKNLIGPKRKAAQTTERPGGNSNLIKPTESKLIINLDWELRVWPNFAHKLRNPKWPDISQNCDVANCSGNTNTLNMASSTIHPQRWISNRVAPDAKRVLSNACDPVLLSQTQGFFRICSFLQYWH